MGHQPEDVMGTAVDLYVMGAAMRSVPGRIVRQEGQELTVDLGDGSLGGGEAVYLQPVKDGPWLFGHVSPVGNDRRQVLIHVDETKSTDLREYPRVAGPLKLRYQAVPAHQAELAGRRWLQSASGIGPRWLRPDTFVDFSASGARFRIDEPGCDANDRLLVGVKIPGESVEHRFVARVVRHLVEEAQVAIQFLDGTEAGFNAIVEFADRIHDLQLEELSETDE